MTLKERQIVGGILVSLTMLLLISVGKVNSYRLQVEGLRGQLNRTQTALRDLNKRFSTYKDATTATYQTPDTDQIVQDKYTNGYNYTIVVGNDYYPVNAQQYHQAVIGQQFDVSQIEKGE